ncbi:MAG TPA: hypothetical protein PK331_13510 [Gordonia sp. (in: high G+C Gram-positive bacteria)]|uniref:hypothetical protein n=1 Tax=Gordonia sp. (in: high G+C Gram-positive bacteria) TaxID=84139 RepID=UPI002C0B9C63|nr:hypothetical protein [Gordonia sp. (in: high G+C Gram-positive bacteria)]HRC51924.1 hypothetical protein [Gordonia sp. (in: high G+C Gram-positive bacteria)]
MDISEARLGPAAAESVGERARRAAKQLLQRRRGRVERALRDTGIGLGEERRQPLGRAGLEQCLAVVPDGEIAVYDRRSGRVADCRGEVGIRRRRSAQLVDRGGAVDQGGGRRVAWCK